MEICSGRLYETVHRKPAAGSYEWWYFDGWDETTRTGFVLIFYEGNPFSARYLGKIRRGEPVTAKEYPAVSLSIYHDGSPVYYAFDEVNPEEAAIQAPDAMEIAGCRWSFSEEDGEWIYHLHLDHRMTNGDSVSGSVRMRSKPFEASMEGEGLNRSPNSIPEGNHRWNPVQPDARISGRLTIGGYRPLTIDLSGRGYHDHNVGSEPMRNTFERWYWGRFHLPERTLVYYLMKQSGRWEQRAWLISSDQVVEIPGNSWSFEDVSSNWFGLDAARRLCFEHEDLSLQIDQVNRLDDGPFYQRYASRLLFRERGTILQSEGISEVILPRRIDWRWVRPLVEMRIRYPDRSPHWVQRSPRLYRWTW